MIIVLLDNLKQLPGIALMTVVAESADKAAMFYMAKYDQPPAVAFCITGRLGNEYRFVTPNRILDEAGS